jgi:hypothetical protein
MIVNDFVHMAKRYVSLIHVSDATRVFCLGEF